MKKRFLLIRIMIVIVSIISIIVGMSVMNDEQTSDVVLLLWVAYGVGFLWFAMWFNGYQSRIGYKEFDEKMASWKYLEVLEEN